jgi:uncharacterized protein (DUF4415 family)
LPLSVGEIALADPLGLSRQDPHPDGDRWNTICQINGVLLFIVHTWPEADDAPGRIVRPERQPDKNGGLTKMADIRKLNADEQAALDEVAGMSDSEIDTSEMPEITDWNGAIRGGLYRPVKRLTSLRLDADVLEWFRRGGEGYQTRINAALREYVERHQR